MKNTINKIIIFALILQLSSIFALKQSALSSSLELSAFPNPVLSGKTSELHWSAIGFKDCKIIGGDLSIDINYDNSFITVAPTKTTEYVITCLDDNNEAISDSEIIAIEYMTAPKAPSNLVGSVNMAQTKIDLKWQDNSNNTKGFYLERSTGDCNIFNKLDSNISENFMSDNYSIVPNTTYCYRVKAFNEMGFSDFSNIFQIKTGEIITPKTPDTLPMPILQPIEEYEPLTISEPTNETSKGYTLKIGEKMNIANNLISIKLIELPIGPNCQETKTACDNFAKIELIINNKEPKTISINQHSAYTDDSLGELVINFTGKKDEQTGSFHVYFKPLTLPAKQTTPIEISLDTKMEKIPEYQIVKPLINSKDIISISADGISIKKDIEEMPTILKMAPVNGVKNAVRIEIDSETGIAEKKEITFKQIDNKLVLETVKSTTISPECSEYLSLCKKGDDMFCQKHKENCAASEKSQCDNYLMSCKKGSAESCEKWDLNCKNSTIANPEECEKHLLLCESGSITSCKTYQNSCKKDNATIAISSAPLQIQNNKIWMNDKEIKIMPDTASETAIETLQLKKDVSIELKQTGKSVGENKPSYEIIGEKEARIFGFIKTKMNVKTEINAETGKIEKITKPWWKFLDW